MGLLTSDAEEEFPSCKRERDSDRALLVLDDVGAASLLETALSDGMFDSRLGGVAGNGSVASLLGVLRRTGDTDFAGTDETRLGGVIGRGGAASFEGVREPYRERFLLPPKIDKDSVVG